MPILISAHYPYLLLPLSSVSVYHLCHSPSLPFPVSPSLSLLFPWLRYSLLTVSNMDLLLPLMDGLGPHYDARVDHLMDR